MGYDNDCSGGAAVCLGQENTITDGSSGGGGDGTAQSAVAIGRGNHAAGSYSVAMGKNCIARGPGYTDRGCCVAMGYECDASAIFNDGWSFNVGGAVAMGASCRAYGGASFAAGYDCSAQGDFSVAMGYRCDASKNNSIALGRENLTTGFGSTALGGYCEASGTYSLVQGLQSKALGYNSVAMGKDCRAEGDYSVAMGYHCRTDLSGSIAMGWDCSSTGGIAIGTDCTAWSLAGSYHMPNIAMGLRCRATGGQSIVMGIDCSASHSQGIAMGRHCYSTMNAGMAFGNYATAGGWASFAAGNSVLADACGAVAIGWQCKARENNNVALGDTADASGTGGFVYRSNAGNTFVFDDAGPSLKINGSAVASGAYSHGYKMITPTTSKPGGGTWNGSSCSVLDVTGLSLSDLTPTTRCKITILGAGGGGGYGGANSYGGGGGSGGMCVWMGLMDASWTHAGTLTLGAGGAGGDGPGGSGTSGFTGGATSWPAISLGTAQIGSILGGFGGNNGISVSAGGACYGTIDLQFIGGGGAGGDATGWRATAKVGGVTSGAPLGTGTGGTTYQGGLGGASPLNPYGPNFAGGLGGGGAGAAAKNGADGKFGAGGGGGGGDSLTLGHEGGKGGDACVIIEWWL